MTKQQAAEKVCKLRRLAEKAGCTPAEAESARRIADKILTEHHLGPGDLTLGAKCAAFDELVTQLEIFVAAHPERSVPMTVVKESLARLKKEVKSEDKAKALDTTVSATRAMSFLAGSSKTVSGLKSVVDEVLRKHDVTI
jgi:hypothetical protein